MPDKVTITEYAEDSTGELYSTTQVWRPAMPWETGVALQGRTGAWVLAAHGGELPTTAARLTASEYAAKTAARRANHDAIERSVAETNQTQVLEVYNELVRLGMAEGPAARLAGYERGGS
jgi:hypothetical protein